MKKLLLLVLLCVSFGAMGQTVPARGATVIYVTLPDSGVVAWQRLGAELVQAGFPLKASDEKLLTISTEYKQLDANLGVAVTGSVQGRRVMLRGQLSNVLLDTRGLPVVYPGKPNGTQGRSWAQLEAVARQMGGSVSYELPR